MKKFYPSLLTLLIIASPAFSHAQTLSVSPSELLRLVNNERTTASVPALTSNAILAEVAQERANDLLSKQYFAHTSPDGKQFYQWIDESGYTYSIAGENIIIQLNGVSIDKMITSWMNSAEHRANILSDKYSETGLGVVSGMYQGKPAVIAVEIFASPRGIPNTQTVVAPTSLPQVLRPTQVLSPKTVVPAPQPVAAAVAQDTVKKTALPASKPVVAKPAKTAQVVSATVSAAKAEASIDMNPIVEPVIVNNIQAPTFTDKIKHFFAPLLLLVRNIALHLA